MAADALNKLGKYEIRGRLGKGAMGVVYDGFDPVIQRRVAIKTIARQSMDPSEAAELLARFKREAQAAGRLNHPGIVAIHDYGEDDGLAFIAMEFIKGDELRTYFDSQQRFALTHIVRIVCDILDALDHAHRNGVVHRDIKPANIMITDEGRVKVADFGVARIESSMMTQIGVRIGTPAYMSPEQHQGLPVSGRSDLFSVGVVLYQFLTGARPFTGDGYAIVQKILLQEAIPPSEINRDIPPTLDAVTMKALAKRPEDRFATASEFAAAIREAVTVNESVGSGLDVVFNDRTLRLNAQSATPLSGSGWGSSMAGTSAISSGGSSLSEVSLEAELEYWKEIKDSTETADFEIFLEVFPQSRFAPLARRRMDRLEAEAKAGQVAGERGCEEAAERSRIENEQAGRSAAEEETHRSDPGREPRECEAQAPSQEEERRQREEEAIRLLAEADSRRAAEEHVRKEAAEQEHRKAEARKRAQARSHKHRHVDWRLPRLDAEEPRLMPRAGAEASDLVPAMDLSPRMEPSVPSTAGLPHFEAASSRVRAGRRLPIAAALGAVLIGSGIWYATTRTELAPIVTVLKMQTQAVLGQLQQLWHVVEARQEPMVDEAARLAEEQRRNEDALNAERNRQAALARQKEEAAKAARAQNYQRAMALLDQGRSSEAVRLLRQLAHGGHGAAAKTLGDLYSSGEKVLLDRQEASHFYAIAERNGVKIDRSTFVRR